MKSDTSCIDSLELNLARRNTVGDALTRAAERNPNNLAFVDAGRRISYTTFEHDAEALARGIIGLDNAPLHQEPIAVIMPNRYEFMVSYFGIAKAGRVVVPINYGFAPADIAWMLGDAGARTVIVDETLIPVMNAVLEAGAHVDTVVVLQQSDGEIPVIPGVRTRAFAELLAVPVEDELRVFISSDDVVQCLYTSGTTGKPKGALATHASMVTAVLSNSHLLGEDWSWNPGKLLLVLPMFHTLALNALSKPVLFLGGTVVVHRGFDPAAVLDTIEAEKIDHFGGLPMMWAALIAENESNARDLASIKTALYAMTQMPERILAGMDAMMPQARKVLGSGQTEVIPATTYQKPEHRFTKNASWGQPVLTVRARIMGSEGELLPIGEVGEIVYRGPHVTPGYWNRPDANEEVFRNGWFRSGDIGYIDDEGVIWFKDRTKDIVKSGGVNVSSMNVERVVMGAPGVVECSVIGTAHEHWGEAVTVIVVSDALPAISDVSEAEFARAREQVVEGILDYAKDMLGKFEVPKRVEFVEVLPKTATGKVQKHVLREQFS